MVIPPPSSSPRRQKLNAAVGAVHARHRGGEHYIDAGNDPHVVMQWSGHRTTSMLLRYHIARQKSKKT